MKGNLLLKSFIGFSAIYLFVILTGREDIAWFMKPFLIPFLILAVYNQEYFTTKNILLAALTFSWIGDIILLFADTAEIYFILGLIAFLISHIVYIILFSKQLKTIRKKNKAIYWIGITAIIVYLMVMLAVLFPNLGDLKIPVFVYAMVISTMLLFAFKGYFIWGKPANNYILLGAVFFVTSDSILAFNKFYEPVIWSSFFIMATYLLAQYLIVIGILKLNQKK
ncbi:lysoplasmalogenase [Flavobacterium sp. K5-23]|uniref:lysoplasmalogenase n=1 Tax=Flavobacterium sp. K5-23 TaxID=2746225 RepID=UPI00200C1192|nr:lysoplasmalogenase [Flavobacterium sp. K5-23]UQD56795.1 lysoplasmalogenase [Flavobacterium sp. K5-23]